MATYSDLREFIDQNWNDQDNTYVSYAYDCLGWTESCFIAKIDGKYVHGGFGNEEIYGTYDSLDELFNDDVCQAADDDLEDDGFGICEGQPDIDGFQIDEIELDEPKELEEEGLTEDANGNSNIKTYSCKNNFDHSFTIRGDEETLKQVQAKSGLNFNNMNPEVAQDLYKYLSKHAIKYYTYNDSYRGDDSVMTVKDQDLLVYVIYSSWNNMQGSRRETIQFVTPDEAAKCYNTKPDIDFGWC